MAVRSLYSTMSKQLLRALPELIAAGVIDVTTAERIRAHYDQQDGNAPNRLFVVFGILGGLLVGLGIVLILAHNWDDLDRTAKVAIGLLPLIIGQLVTGWIVFKGKEDRAWREGTAAFLFCAIGVSIAIVSQAYNLEGDLADFLLTWTLLAVPAIFVLRSAAAAMLCVGSITWHACQLSYFTFLGSHTAPMYWVVIALILPYYYFAFIKPLRKDNFYIALSWMLVLSLTICLATVAENTGRLFLIAYAAMFSLFIVAGESALLKTGRVLSNSYLVAGSLGVIVILLTASFVDFWEWRTVPDDFRYSILGLVVIVVLSMLATAVLVWQFRSMGGASLNPKSLAFLFLILIYSIGVQVPAIGALLVNASVFVIAVATIRSGARQNHLGILNYGLLIITALILCRFFDTDLSFVIRGLLFIAVGAGFFAANYYLIKQRKTRP